MIVMKGLSIGYSLLRINDGGDDGGEDGKRILAMGFCSILICFYCIG